MKVFLSSIESPKIYYWYIARSIGKLNYNLMSYYYLRGGYDIAEDCRDRSKLVIIDSGAHSFQKGTKVNWLEYTNQYAEFIRRFDRPNVVGYFEMDVDNILGYDNVLKLRKILTRASDKIIPVWHKGRGIDEYKRMCEEYSGRVVAITGFKNEDIKDEQYTMFLKYAWSKGCKLHCLGMTRRDILDKVPFDYVDSSSWKQASFRGKLLETGDKVSRKMTRERCEVVAANNYRYWMKLQERYEAKWRKYEH